MLVASLTSASIAACAKHSEHEKSYTRAPMRARSIAPRIEFGAAGRSRSAAQICRSRWCGALDLDRFELRILNDEVLAAGHHVYTLHAWTFATILGSSACADALERRWQGATYPSLSAIARAIHSHRNFDQRCMRLYVIGKTGPGAPS